MSITKTTEQLQSLDVQRHLHPFTDFNNYAKKPGRIISRAEHIYIYDTDGTEFLDAMSGLWCCSLGYSQPEIAAAVSAQFQQLPYYNNFFQCSNEPAVELADRLVKMTPEQFTHVFFTNSGSEANDTNIRLIRRYWDLKNQPNKRIILARTNAYHGSTIAAASLGGFSSVHDQFETLPYVQHIADPNWYNSGGDMTAHEFGIAAARELEKRIDQLGEENVAAFIAEPIQGAGGVIVPPDSYWPEVSRILKERDILFVSDEVICGFARTGSMFGCETYNTEPDLMTFAKAVTNGFQPLGGVMVSDRVASVITSSGGEFGHGFTYSGHPIACAAALATLDILERDNIVARVAKNVGPYLQKRWAELGDHPIVGHTRGIGMIGSLELVRNKVTKERLEPEQQAGGVCREFCIDNGLVMRAVGDSMIISPQLIMNHEEIDTMIERATKALDQTAQHYSV
ncbi:MAG: aminotransferase [Porticoccaceae bacterium]|nr:aminotransferase [Porticoccaceae bacterium]MDG1307226.1 aminotransferase [Porticoccaceae bacterium]